ncbi:DUF3696 domain-containing protein [Archangium primigenium]|uniref:DUF3696 domain-containing protein n=1 Tax=[Archangium] primigenium TaxID=2792470 RepID=UPI001958567E|nr:DUF3696 domain-containing protein [Archangium primigenium]MBM7112852.1 DUF3696 domain-containing protein [Archangium primigenium]
MLTRLRIQNFKAWQDTGDIRLAPLTVFFGTNSSGKTSLLQFLLMLKQTVQSTDRRRALNFGDSRSLVDLGVWPEMVFRHEPSRTIEFSLELFPTRSMWLDRLIGRDGAESMSFAASIGSVDSENERAELKSYNYRHMSSPDGPLELGAQRMGLNQYQIQFSPAPPAPPYSQVISAIPVHFNGIRINPTETNISQYGLKVFMEDNYDLQESLAQNLDSIRYLAPVRIPPSRLYTWAGDAPEDVGPDGELIIEALLASRERMFTSPSEEQHFQLEVLVAKWLQCLGLLDSFDIKSIAPNRKEYEVLVRAMGMKDAVNLTDVGFGVSQVLPVLVQLLYVERGSTLIFEQPELHLHPRAQSALADIFIEALKMQENTQMGGEKRDIQLLVETHSEHFLRRLQRRIAEQNLSPSDVALYFCKPGPEGSTIEELKLDDFGNITNWPENFFGDEVGDLAAMTEAAMKRQLGSEES